MYIYDILLDIPQRARLALVQHMRDTVHVEIRTKLRLVNRGATFV
jgi:hypothetical protein